MNKNLLAFCLVLATVFIFIYSRELPAQHRSDYAGQQLREVKSLSKSDIEELSSGKGWGLAKSAELNGFPGPVHLIEMKKELGLDRDQLSAIRELHSQMKNKAIPFGLRLIKLEKELDREFKTDTIDRKRLMTLLEQIAEVYKNLRFVHLSAHLNTKKLLTKQQIILYRKLRGYESGDPCTNMPNGHDPELWKKHNNCK